MLTGMRVAEATEDVDARFAHVGIVSDRSYSALAVWVDLDGGAIAEEVGDREKRIFEGRDGVDLVQNVEALASGGVSENEG